MTNTKAISSYVRITPPLPLTGHTVVDCGSPPTLDNGRIAMQDMTTFDSVVTYECNENYFFDNGTKSSRTCLSSGEWSNEDIQCSKSFEDYHPFIHVHTVAYPGGTGVFEHPPQRQLINYSYIQSYYSRSRRLTHASMLDTIEIVCSRGRLTYLYIIIAQS